MDPTEEFLLEFSEEILLFIILIILIVFCIVIYKLYGTIASLDRKITLLCSKELYS